MTIATASTGHAYTLPGSRQGILLIHGLTGTPAEMRVLANGLHRAGYTVHCMQLAGHCATVEDLLQTDLHDWRRSVEQAAACLRTSVDELYVGGLSMGALLALDYAARHPDGVQGVMALAPVFQHDGWSMPWHARLGEWLLPCLKWLNLGRQWVIKEGPPYGIKDRAIRRRVVEAMHAGKSEQAGLAGVPCFALVEMYRLVRSLRRRMNTIKCPCLVIHAVHDDVAGKQNALTVQREVGAQRVQLVWLTDSYHLITVDRERRQVIAHCAAFLERVKPREPSLPAVPSPA